MSPKRAPAAELALAGLIFIAAFAGIYSLSYWKFYQYSWSARDVWFDNDSDRVFAIEAETGEDYDRTLMHPLHPYIARPAIRLLMVYPRIDVRAAARIFHSGIGALWVAGFYLLLRRFGCRRLDSAALTGVLASSATAFFWLPMIETFVLGGVSIFPALALAAGPTGRFWPHVAASLASIGITVTNWMAGLFSAFLSLPRRKFLALLIVTLAVTGVFAALTKVVFPGSAVALRDSAGEMAWIFSPESSGPFAILRAFFFHSMVAPEIRFLSNWRESFFPMLSVQASDLLTGPRPWTWLATVSWAGLLAAGVYGLVRLDDRKPLRNTLLLFVLYQVLLHLLYGKETFLYAPHYAPVLVACAALATLTPLRPAVLALSAILIVANAPANYAQFRWAKQYTLRQQPISQMNKRGALRPVRAKLEMDPTWEFRFWRDLDFGAGD